MEGKVRSVIYLIGSARFNLVVLLIILITMTILPAKLWSIPQDLNNNSPKNFNKLLKPSYIDIYSELKADKKRVFPNGTITYTFTFINIGNENPKDLKIVFYAPNEMLKDEFYGNFTRLSEINSASNGIQLDSIVYVDDTSKLLKKIHWHMNELVCVDSLDSQKIVLTLRVDNLQESKSLTGFMTLKCEPDFYDQRPSNVILILLPELTVTKSVAPVGPYYPGETGTYTINYRNNGDRQIDSVIIKDSLPSDLIILGNPSPPPTDTTNGVYTWDIEILTPQTGGQIAIQFQVDPKITIESAYKKISNLAILKSGIIEKSSRADFNVEASDIQAKIHLLPEFYSPGYPIKLKATIKNIGPSPVTDPFRAAFYWHQINSVNFIGDTILTYLKENAQDSAIITKTWENPPEGDQTIIVFADCDYAITEMSEKNNIDSTIARVQISELHVYTNEMIYYDNMIRRISPQFPKNIFTYLSVLDQNLHPVRKLSNSLGWISENNMSELDVKLSDIWFLTENGQPVDSLLVTEILPDAEFPISTTLVIPITKANILTAIKAKLCDFVDRFSTTKDQFSVVSYSDHLLNVLAFSNNFENVCNVVRQESDGQATALFDAIYRGVAETAKQPNRRAVITVTDGNNYSFIQNYRVIEYANRLGVPIFVLNYGDVNQQILQTLADDCGGLYFEITSEDTLTDVFQKLYDILNNYYVVSYTTPTLAMDGNWRPLEILIKYPNYLEPVGENDQGRYLAPTNAAQIWMDIASFPSGLDVNYYGQLWKLTQKQESYEYVITFSNRGNDRVENLSLVNWESPYVDIGSAINQSYTAEMGQNHIVNFMVNVKDELPLQWLSIIDSAKINLGQELMATATDTVWLTQDLEPEIRVAYANQPYPQSDEPLRITLVDKIMFWVSWPMNLVDFSIKLIPYQSAEIDFTPEITNMPIFPVGPGTLAIEPDYQPPKKFTELEEEPWVVRFEYVDQLGRPGFVETMFYILAPNKLVLDKNVVRNGDDVNLIVFISRENHLKIDVFNVVGEHIKNLEDKFYPWGSEATMTGKHLTWDCTDSDGRTVGSDVYVVVMEAGGFKTWKKVIVVH